MKNIELNMFRKIGMLQGGINKTNTISTGAMLPFLCYHNHLAF